MTQPSTREWASEPRTLLKHQIYKRYLDCWMPKILQVFPAATVVDAFAGPGAYTDGPQGSPLVIARAFLDHTSRDRFRDLTLLFNEARQDRRDSLQARIDGLPNDAHLHPTVMPASDFQSAFSTIAGLAHAAGPTTPTLWILDPFDIKSAPSDLVRRCITRSHDEMLLTWFADEIYRFCEVPSFTAALTAHYGGEHWRAALHETTEHGRKGAFARIYRETLEQVPGVMTSTFEISARNATARYSIMFATHSTHGLDCWNPVKWGLDPAAGRSASERRVPQDALFDDRSELRRALDLRAGAASTFSELQSTARQLGFMDKQLRQVLDEMFEDGVAVRESPLKARTPWPEGSVIRFYSPGEETTEPDA